MKDPAEYYMRDRRLHPPAYVPGYKTSVARSPRQALISLENTLSEITGPRFGHSDIEPRDNRLLIFFSDSRCPHEVLESAASRFALSVWYCTTSLGAGAIDTF